MKPLEPRVGLRTRVTSLRHAERDVLARRHVREERERLGDEREAACFRADGDAGSNVDYDLVIETERAFRGSVDPCDER